MNSQDGNSFVVSWDLQTGGVVSIIRWQDPTEMEDTETLSVTYSANGKFVGVAFCHEEKPSYFMICDVASGTLVHSHSLDDTKRLSNHIWTHGESLRFATTHTTAITVWEVRFTSGAIPMEVETLPAPDGFCEMDLVQLHPSPYRLAFVPTYRVLVWDARNSRYLHEYGGANFSPTTSFSSDGRFFACSTTELKVYLWKESSARYTLHGILASNSEDPIPVLTQNGESIVTFGSLGCAVQLWHTKTLITPTLGVLVRRPQPTEDFILEFSPGGVFAVVAIRRRRKVTVLNLKSGVLQLTIDAGMDIYGLGAIGNTVVVIGGSFIGGWTITAWNLPAEDYVLHARVGPEDSSWTTKLAWNGVTHMDHTSVSPDSPHIAITNVSGLTISNISTGEFVGRASRSLMDTVPRFSPDGCNVWCAAYDGKASVWRVGGGQKVLELLESRVGIEHPSEGSPWGSSHGYRVTDDGWILGPDRRRLLLLPPPWRSFAMFRVWKGPFLALLHHGLSEPVILEFV